MEHLTASNARMKDYGSFDSMVQPVGVVESFLSQTTTYLDGGASNSNSDYSLIPAAVSNSNSNHQAAGPHKISVEDPPLQRIDDEIAKLTNVGLVGETDALMAKELNQLSMKEREEVNHDIHGVAEIVEEAPEFLQIKVKELEMELENIPLKDAYHQAKEKAPDYVTSLRNCLMFLRADRFDAKEAAARMVRYYEEKLCLFGHEPLARDLLMSDLNEEERSSLKAGYIQLLPRRDRAGRAIIFGLNKLRTGAFRGASVRCMFMWMLVGLYPIMFYDDRWVLTI
jgi:hypothetical protein